MSVAACARRVLRASAARQTPMTARTTTVRTTPPVWMGSTTTPASVHPTTQVNPIDHGAVILQSLGLCSSETSRVIKSMQQCRHTHTHTQPHTLSMLLEWWLCNGQPLCSDLRLLLWEFGEKGKERERERVALIENW